MKLIRVLSEAIGWLLAFSSAAHAGPITLAVTGLLTAIGVGAATASFIATAAVGVLINVGIGLITRALRKKPDDAPATEASPPSGVSGSIQVGGDNPLSFIMGIYATAGSLEYAATWGETVLAGDGENKTPNAFLVQVVSLADLPMTGMPGVFVDGEPGTLVAPIAGQESFGLAVNQYRIGSLDHLWVKFYDGTQTVVDPYLLNRFGTADVRPWTSDMVGRGVAHAIVTSRVNRELFTGIPQLKFVCLGMKLYDLRLDSTNGGSGTQRWNDQSTWAFSSNLAVMTYNVIRGIYYGGTWVYGGQNLAAARLPAASWIAAANVCDQFMPVAGADSERQYRGGAEIFVNVPALDMVEEFLKGCNGHIAEIGGVYKMVCGAPAAASMSFTDDDVIITSKRSMDPFPGLENTYNGIHASYPEPREAWVNKDAPPRYNSTWEAQDDGRRLIADAVFSVVPYPTQVQRLMLSLIQANRRFRKHVITLPPEAWLLEPNDTVEWTSAHNGYIDKLFIVQGIDGPPGYNQTLTILEVDPSDYDYDVDFELPDSVGVLTTVRPPPQAIVDWFATGITITGDDGKQRAGILLQWDGDQDDVRAVQFQVRLASDPDDIVHEGVTENVSRGAIKIAQNIFSSTAYEARGIYKPFSGRRTEWSTWLALTTPATPMNDLSVELDALGESARAAFKSEYQRIANRFHEFEVFAANVGSANADDIVQKNIFNKRAGRLSAQIIEESVIRVSADEALAQQTLVLESRMDGTDSAIEAQALAIQAFSTHLELVDDQIIATAEFIVGVQAMTVYGTASGSMGWVVTSGPAGVSARYSLIGRIAVDGDVYNGGMLFDINANGTSQIMFDVTRFVILSSEVAGATKFRPFVVEGGILKVDQIQVNGAKIQDATIVRAKIANAAIGTAQIDDAAIKSAKIGDLEVDTIKIKYGAIARRGGISGSGSSNAVGQVVVLGTVTCDNPSGAAVMIELQASYELAGAPGCSGTIRIMRNGVQLAGPTIIVNIATLPVTGNDQKFTMDFPAAGTSVYQMQVVLLNKPSALAASMTATAALMRLSWTSR